MFESWLMFVTLPVAALGLIIWILVSPRGWSAGNLEDETDTNQVVTLRGCGIFMQCAKPGWKRPGDSTFRQRRRPNKSYRFRLPAHGIRASSGCGHAAWTRRSVFFSGARHVQRKYAVKASQILGGVLGRERLHCATGRQLWSARL